MKVVDLGHGQVGIEPTETQTDAVGAWSTEQLKLNRISDEAISIYQRYLRRIASAAR
jgi:hypothetical protein